MLDIGYFILSLGTVIIASMLMVAVVLGCTGLIVNALTYVKMRWWEHGKWI